MNRPLKIGLRLVVLAALVVSVQVLSGPASSGNSPYLSALSDLTGGAVIAAPGCNTKYCAKEPGRKSPTCHQSTSLYNCSASGGVCTITPC
jgi:hypothetical protein